MHSRSAPPRPALSSACGRGRWTLPRRRRPRRPSGDVAELLCLGEALQLLERLVLDLTDALARDVERAADLIERPGMLAAQPVAQLEHTPFAVGEVLERLPESLLGEDLGGALVG